MPELDAHGQPLNRRYNQAWVEDRQVDELIGLCRGVAADGIIAQEEAQFLLDWMSHNRDVKERWPANTLYARISDMLKDGLLDPDEQKELLGLLQGLSGPRPDDDSHENMSTTLPLNDPLPDIVFEGRAFCLTGKFATGTRKHCEGLVKERGGRTLSKPSRITDFVVGIVGSRDWIHFPYSRKIEDAVYFRKYGTPVAIVPERHWASFL